LAGFPVTAANVIVVWQVPQSPVDGWFGSFAAVGRVTIDTPKKVLFVSWHAAQPPAMPAWFIAVPENFDVEWHVSHDAFVGIWFAGIPSAEIPLWQLAQLPRATLVWSNRPDFQARSW